MLWNEPHWTVPEHVGMDDPKRWACVCQICAELSGLDLSQGLTPEVEQFRERSIVDFLGEVTAHVASRGGKNTICLLPLTEGPHGVGDWDAVAALPHLSVRPTAEFVQLVNAEDRTIAGAVADAAESIAGAIDSIVERLEVGGRLVYVGAGSSGRAAAADAAECGPTFSTDRIVAVTTEEESAEDDTEAGARELEALGVGPKDVVLGVSASGRTLF